MDMGTNTNMQRVYRVRVRNVMAGLLLGATLGAFAMPATAQRVEPYEYARTGRATITLYVWGAVDRPGIWHVERDATLIEVLSLANVQTGKSAQEKRFLRIYRGGEATSSPPDPGARRDLVFESDLQDVLTSARVAPGIQDGDIISIEVEIQEKVFTLRNISSFIGTAASLTLLIIRLTSL